WDAVAALNTPTVIHGEWLPGFAGDGSPLDAAPVTERRDAFFRTALDQLPTPISCPRRCRHADTETPLTRSIRHARSGTLRKLAHAMGPQSGAQVGRHCASLAHCCQCVRW